MNFIILFTVLQLVNVMLNTLKTCIMIKGNKIASSLINAITYGFYTIVVVYTASDYSMLTKIIITIITNLIGVYISMIIMEKIKKDKLWVITATTKKDKYQFIINEFEKYKIQYNYQFLNKGIGFTIYSYNQKESKNIKEILIKYDAKFTAIEQNAKL